MSEMWAIDTLDCRGGLAFASYRTYSLADEGDQLREAPCVWIAPPYFEPEPVVSRALAWSADRGAFQLGLFHDGKEIRFETIEAVTEFVRRTYLRSAGGDGLVGGGSPLPLPPLPDDRPDLDSPTLRLDRDERSIPGDSPFQSPRGGGGTGGAVDVLRLLRNFGDHAAALSGPVAGAPMQWIGNDDDLFVTTPLQVGKLQGAQDQLGWASLLLLHELLLRLPTALRSAELLNWERSARTLGSIITGLGTWDWLIRGAYQSTLIDWATVIGRMVKRMGFISVGFSQEIDRFDDLGFVVFYSRLFSTGAYRAFRRSEQPWAYDPLLIGVDTYEAHATSDSVEDLSRLPLPFALARCVRKDEHGGVSVLQLLSAASGAPLSICDDGANGQNAVAVLLLAAGWILRSQDTRSSPNTWTALDHFPHLEEIRESDLVKRAWAWLSRSMPRLAFPNEIETMIAQASSMRYGGEATSGASDPSPQGNPPRSDSTVVLEEAPSEDFLRATNVTETKSDEGKGKNERTQRREPPALSA